MALNWLHANQNAWWEGIVVPSALRTHRYAVRRFRLTCLGKPLDEPLTILSDPRRSLPTYAKVFCDLLARHVRKVFPVGARP